MVLKPKKKAVAEEEVVVEELEEEEGEEPKVETYEPENPNPPEEKDTQVVGYPVFPTQADINRMIYENNQMLRTLVEAK